MDANELWLKLYKIRAKYLTGLTAGFVAVLMLLVTVFTSVEEELAAVIFLGACFAGIITFIGLLISLACVPPGTEEDEKE